MCFLSDSMWLFVYKINMIGVASYLNQSQQNLQQYNINRDTVSIILTNVTEIKLPNDQVL